MSHLPNTRAAGNRGRARPADIPEREDTGLLAQPLFRVLGGRLHGCQPL